MKPIQVYVSDVDKKTLDHIADEQQISISELIREALDVYTYPKYKSNANSNPNESLVTTEVAI